MTWIAFSIVALCIPVILFKRALSFKKNSISSIDHILKEAETLIKGDQFHRALQLLKPLEPKGVGGAKTYLLVAQALRLSCREREALCKVESALSIYPDFLPLHKELGKLRLTLGQYALAMDSFLKALPILRGEEEFLLLASASFQARKIEVTWRYLAPFLEKSSNGRLFSLAADCQFFRKDFIRATKLYEQARSYGWVNYRLLCRLAHCYRMQKDFTQSEEIFRSLLLDDPGDVVANLGLGLCYEARGLAVKALLLYQQEEVWKKRDLRLIKRCGHCSYEVGKYQAAALYLEEVRQKEKSPHYHTLLFLAFSYLRLKEWGKAQELFLQLIEFFPQSFQGYRGLAWLFGVGVSDKLEADEALLAAHKSVAMKQDRTSLEILSACHARMGQFTEAHRIQEHLSRAEESKECRLRRLRAMRTLRKQEPLNQELVAH